PRLAFYEYRTDECPETPCLDRIKPEKTSRRSRRRFDRWSALPSGRPSWTASTRLPRHSRASVRLGFWKWWKITTARPIERFIPSSSLERSTSFTSSRRNPREASRLRLRKSKPSNAGSKRRRNIMRRDEAKTVRQERPEMIEESSGNVFADLNLENPEELL